MRAERRAAVQAWDEETVRRRTDPTEVGRPPTRAEAAAAVARAARSGALMEAQRDVIPARLPADLAAGVGGAMRVTAW